MAHRAALSSFRPFSVAGSVCRRTSPSAPPSWSVASALRAALLRQRPQPLARSQPPTVVLQSRGLRTTQQQPAKQGKATATARVVKPRSAANAIGLNSIKDNPGARITRKRWGRGLGSGRGKRSGRGNKGWTNRHSGQPGPRGFEGGQTPFFQVVPKHGVRLGSPLRTYAEVNLDRLQHWIDTGRIDPKQPITISVLVKSGCVRSLEDGVVLLASGGQYLKTSNLDIRVTRASAGAIRRVEELGGKIVTSFLSPAERQYHLRPEKFAIPPRPSIPMDTNVLKHYLSPTKRGNLSLEKVGGRGVVRIKSTATAESS